MSHQSGRPASSLPEAGTVLTHRDGRTITFVDHGRDDTGDYLLLEHRIPQQGAMNGPHWHPQLEESFVVEAGRMRFRVDGQDRVLLAGEQLTVRPRQVHQFWNESEDGLVALHTIRPPGQHWKMFALIHKLELEGKLSKGGMPRHPLWLGAAWASIDGYLAGPPLWLQRLVLGGLARAAERRGYRV
ncbi:cupin domain-containing protein [Paenibacillus sp. IB182496]|uniref:Cupin domain-containing protein n=1 Tax=Paenibacillus sabuli TaxID=2772509 RepID=A0A927BX10_9BACL|nr:cupin domain-containing protein [Paenibacillus sabuli]MBD2846999.1 cupin domain-containing protein [Paenibacillus sabuli]